jgi:hypothetical protein
VTIRNGFEATGDVGVELEAQTKNGWERIDLSAVPEMSFCFNKPGQEFHNAILVRSGIPTIAAIWEARRALESLGLLGEGAERPAGAASRTAPTSPRRSPSALTPSGSTRR